MSTLHQCQACGARGYHEWNCPLNIPTQSAAMPHVYSPREGTEVCFICGFHKREHAPEHFETSAIAVRPVYDGRRSLRQKFGIYAGKVLTVVTTGYPSKLMRELVSGDPRNSRDPMKYEGRDWKVQS